MKTRLVRIPRYIPTALIREAIQSYDDLPEDVKSLPFFSEQAEGLKELSLYEGLITSYPFEIVARELANAKFKIFTNDPDRKEISVDPNYDREDELNRILNRVGWFVATPSKKTWKIEPKFDLELTEIPETIFHATENFPERIEKILRVGLTPRSGNKRSEHPERIYFGTTAAHSAYFGSRVFPDKGYVILKINTSRLQDGTRFFRDRNMTGIDGKIAGIYTLSNIPSSAISIQ